MTKYQLRYVGRTPKMLKARKVRSAEQSAQSTLASSRASSAKRTLARRKPIASSAKPEQLAIDYGSTQRWLYSALWPQSKK